MTFTNLSNCLISFISEALSHEAATHYTCTTNPLKTYKSHVDCLSLATAPVLMVGCSFKYAEPK